jgi:hypothetical protein
LNDGAPAAFQGALEQRRQHTLERRALEVIEENFSYLSHCAARHERENIKTGLDVRGMVPYLSWSGAAPSRVTPVRAVS